MLGKAKVLGEPDNPPVFNPAQFDDHFTGMGGDAVIVTAANGARDLVRLPQTNDRFCDFYGDGQGKLRRVVLLEPGGNPVWDFAKLRAVLPPGSYELGADLLERQPDLAYLGWVLGSYRFGRYKTQDVPAPSEGPRLFPIEDAAARECLTLASAVFAMQDMVNTPAGDFGPDTLAAEAKALAARHGADMRVIVGDDLNGAEYPLIHAVGRAADRPPALIDLLWGEASHPQLVIVGKGVCFDSGGLNLKSSDAITLMKKDMAGAAQALALAHLVMQSNLAVRLRLLVPAVENAVAGNALRPGDVIKSRKGLTVEITNTDAEGRLILADALSAACETEPDLIIDFATLTGAQRIACGYDLPSYYSNRDDIALLLDSCAARVCDSIWHFPLHTPYRNQLRSSVADLINRPPTRVGGSILAALFLQTFVDPDVPWLHFDFMGWTMNSQPGRPEGGTAQGLRAVFAFLQARYG